MSFEFDNGALSTSTVAGPFDNHYVEVGSDALGTLRFSGHGGSSAQGAMDTTAAGDLWNNTLGLTGGPTPAASGDNSLFYTLPALVDGVAVTASLAPGGTAGTNASTHMSYGVSYTGVEGLTVNYGVGDSGVQDVPENDSTINVTGTFNETVTGSTATNGTVTTTDAYNITETSFVGGLAKTSMGTRPNSFRAYATNAAGTTYSSIVNVNNTGSSDESGIVYCNQSYSSTPSVNKTLCAPSEKLLANELSEPCLGNK